MKAISSIRQATSMAQFHRTPSFRSCTMMQLYIRNNGYHASSDKQSSADQLYFSNDAADDFSTCQRTFHCNTITDDIWQLRILAKAAKLRMLQHMKEFVKEKRRLCLLRSQMSYRAGKECKCLPLQEARHDELAPCASCFPASQPEA